METDQTFVLHAPDARSVVLVVDRGGSITHYDAARRGATWLTTATAHHGDDYWYEVDGVGPLLDPHAADLRWADDGPRSVVRTSWPSQPSLSTRTADPVIYEMHVRGFARTFAGVQQRLDHLVDLGVNVIELMPVHPFDASHNYWGYMPLLWGAVHRSFAADEAFAPEELAALVAAAHARGIEVWLDVVFNHTGEGDATLPTRCLRGIDDAHAYRHHPDGRYIDDSGCGNDANPADPEIRRLVIESLDRFATLGIDGFRFDLASLLTRDDGGMVEMITAWSRRRNVRLIAEPWDLAAYQVGSHLWSAEWMQWNDRFRDDVRGFLRAEAGLVAAMVQRVQGSPDLFGPGSVVSGDVVSGSVVSGSVALRSVNFITAHDGLTMHDLTVVTSDRHRSWDCGPELRLQQLQNYFTVLLLSAGSPMFVMGDEFARTQGGHDNPYNVDSEVSWVDWGRLDEWRELYEFVQRLLRLRREAMGATVTCFGVDGPPDTTYESRSLAWQSGDLYVMVNAWWQPLTFVVQVPGNWQVVAASAATDGRTVAPRSSVVLRRGA